MLDLLSEHSTRFMLQEVMLVQRVESLVDIVRQWVQTDAIRVRVKKDGISDGEL